MESVSRRAYWDIWQRHGSMVYIAEPLIARNEIHGILKGRY